MDSQIERPETTMEFIEIPGVSLQASRIALGTWAIGGWMWGGTDEAESIRTVHEALDRGVTLDRKSTRLNSSHLARSRMPSSA